MDAHDLQGCTAMHYAVHYQLFQAFSNNWVLPETQYDVIYVIGREGIDIHAPNTAGFDACTLLSLSFLCIVEEVSVSPLLQMRFLSLRSLLEFFSSANPLDDAELNERVDRSALERVVKAVKYFRIELSIYRAREEEKGACPFMSSETRGMVDIKKEHEAIREMRDGHMPSIDFSVYDTHEVSHCPFLSSMRTNAAEQQPLDMDNYSKDEIQACPFLSSKAKSAPELKNSPPPSIVKPMPEPASVSPARFRAWLGALVLALPLAYVLWRRSR